MKAGARSFSHTRLFLISLGIAICLFPPYLSLYHDINFPFSGFFMVPVMAIHFVAMLVHEIGHTVTRWLFGYAAFPAFDTDISLGMTKFGARSFLFLGLIWLTFAAGIFYLMKKKLHRQMMLLSAIALAHVLAALTPAHEILILYMGHGMEVIGAFGCIFAALRLMDKYHAGWRIAFMSAALYVILKNILMCLEMIFIHTPRGFGVMKNGLYMSDFLRLQKFTGMSIPVTALPLLVFTVLFLGAAFLMARKQDGGKS